MRSIAIRQIDNTLKKRLRLEAAGQVFPWRSRPGTSFKFQLDVSAMADIFVLDTNVVSELVRERPDPAVPARLATLDESALHLTSITEAEMRHGQTLLPTGRKKTRLNVDVLTLLAHDFAGRIIPFDSAATVYCADLMARRRKSGKPLQVQGAMIAACCLAHVATLVTRNTHDFDGLRLALLYPWPSL